MTDGRRAGLVLAAAIALQAGLAIHAMRGSSATFDEGAHLPAGYSYLATGDHRLNPEQPPLVKLLAALPLRALAPELRTSDLAWEQARQWEFGRRFLYRWNDADRLLFLGRLPVVALASCLVAAVFLVARRRFSPWAAAAAVVLAALSPDVLAHGSLVTTDLAFALFFFLSVVAFDRLLDAPSLARLAAAGLLTGAAFATKFSAPILLPVFLVLGGAALAGKAAGDGARDVKARPATLLVSLFVVLIVALGVVWASYGFRSAITPDPALRSELAKPVQSRPDGALRSFTAFAGRTGIVPEDYARGLLFVTEHSAARPTFLLGERRDGPFPHYFAVTFLLKTPVPLLLLTALALARVPRLARRDALVVWVPVLVYLAATATRGLQIGHRHLLPIYPFLFLAAGEAAAALRGWRAREASQRPPSRAPRGALAAAVLGLWYAGGTLVQHPHHLAYFNELGGGPSNGWRLLVDSNLDWGQDLKRLAAWLREHPAPGLKLSYFGSADPAWYGIASEALPGYAAPHPPRVTREVAPGDVLAVSATNLQGVYLEEEDRALMARIRALQPIARVGYSIFVFRSDFSWPQAPAAAAQAR
jgi:hypothetical protein